MLRCISDNSSFGLLAYMATIQKLIELGKLIPYETELDIGEFADRAISFSPSGVKWFTEVLSKEVAYGVDMTPAEQVEGIFHDYITGRVMVYSRDRKRLRPDSYSAWEMITPHVRIFGWLPRKRHFVVVAGEMKRRLQRHNLYKPFIAQVVDFRRSLDLDEPKHLEGVQPNEIC